MTLMQDNSRSTALVGKATPRSHHCKI
uniref:Uncharacterized protein n=1 Tax=Rhizophora mucronata TaxID=61149 RepID=A0A2P2QDS8_RHIMU